MKIFGRVKENRAHKMKTKGILVEGGVHCSLIGMWYKESVS